MKALARLCVWWPGMDKFIAKKVQSCHSFQVYQNMSVAAPVLHQNATSPWVRVHLDFVE